MRKFLAILLLLPVTCSGADGRAQESRYKSQTGRACSGRGHA